MIISGGSHLSAARSRGAAAHPGVPRMLGDRRTHTIGAKSAGYSSPSPALPCDKSPTTLPRQQRPLPPQATASSNDPENNYGKVLKTESANGRRRRVKEQETGSREKVNCASARIGISPAPGPVQFPCCTKDDDMRPYRSRLGSRPAASQERPRSLRRRRAAMRRRWGVSASGYRRAIFGNFSGACSRDRT